MKSLLCDVAETQREWTLLLKIRNVQGEIGGDRNKEEEEGSSGGGLGAFSS